MRLFGWGVGLRREDAVLSLWAQPTVYSLLHSRDADFVACVQVFEGDARIDGLERRKHVKTGEVLRSSSISAAEQLEQVFAIIDRDGLVKTLVGRVGLEGRERVRELRDEVLVGVLRRTCVLGVLGRGLFVFRLLGDILFAGDGRGQLENWRLEGVHGQVHVDGILSFLDRFQCQNRVERSNVIAVWPFLENHAFVDFDNFYRRVVVFACKQQECTEQ